MKTEKLYDIAEKSKIEVEDLPLSLSSCACEIGDIRHIGLKKDLSETERRVHLAHELGHHKKGGLYYPYSPYLIREKCERQANAWAVYKLIPIRSLRLAVKKGYEEPFEIAEYFNVTETFVHLALDIYQKEGKLPA